MSLSDALRFEGFNLKDIWHKIKKDPERLFIGAADPFSSKVWGKVLGKDYEPMVDQMGGPYGGKFIGGNQGVYADAREHGIDTGTASGLHDIAHTVAGMYAGQYGASKLGGLAGNSSTPESLDSSGGSGMFDFKNPQTYTRFAGMPGQQQDPNAAQREEEERKRRQAMADALRGNTQMRSDFLV